MKKSLLILSILLMTGACSITPTHTDPGTGVGTTLSPEVEAMVDTLNAKQFFYIDLNAGEEGGVGEVGATPFTVNGLGQFEIQCFFNPYDANSPPLVTITNVEPVENSEDVKITALIELRRGTETTIAYVGYTLQDKQLLRQNVHNHYEEDLPPNEIDPTDPIWITYYQKLYTEDNINWDPTVAETEDDMRLKAMIFAAVQPEEETPTE